MTMKMKTTGKAAKAPASKKIELKASVKSATVVMPKLAGNHNETLLAD